VPYLGVFALALFFLGLFVAVERTRRILVVEVDRGRIERLSGRAPADLASDIEDVLRAGRATGRVLLRLEGGRVVVHARGGIDENTKQRLRNVVGRFPVARLRTARRVRRRS